MADNRMLIGTCDCLTALTEVKEESKMGHFGVT
jgi:hypothetical protein